MPRKIKKNNETLEMIVTIIPKGKGQHFIKLYDKAEASLQTADSMMLGLFGLADIEKDVILSLVKKDNKDKLFSILDNELDVHGKGIAFAVSLTGVVGKTLYTFLINQRGDNNGK